MSQNRPMIKGIFVNSHIKAVLREKGPTGIRQLEQKYGKPLNFRNSEDVLVRDEVQLIELALEILDGSKMSPEQRSFEAGRLHFRNFVTTPFAKIINPLLKNEFRRLIFRLPFVAEYIFKGVKFCTEEAGPNCVRVILKNNDYPLEHFKGILYEWLQFAGEKGTVKAKSLPPDKYIYTVEWF